MIRPLITNILSSFADKAFTAVALLGATIVTVRLLSRSDFGIIGIVAGYGAVIQIFSLPLENAILREHRVYEQNAEKFLLNFFFFNIIKGALVVIVGLALAALLPIAYSDRGFAWAVLSLTTVIVGDSLVSPLLLYASARYQQRLVTFANMIRFALNLLLLCGLYWWPSIFYLFVKDAVVMSVTILVWHEVARIGLGLNFAKVSFRRDLDYSFIWKTLTKYSLWVHLLAVANNFIYRADTVFLSLYAPLNVVGNYNVALTGGNVANVAPSILGYQNSVAVSYAADQRHAFSLTDTFIRLSACIGLATFLCFLLFGNVYLRIVTGQSDAGDIYLYMLCIVTGLALAKTVVSPLTAYVNIKGDVRGLFLRVNLPVLLFVMLTYFFAARFVGVVGVAASNILNAMVWVVLLLFEMKRYGYRFPPLSGYAQDFRRIRSYILERRVGSPGT